MFICVLFDIVICFCLQKKDYTDPSHHAREVEWSLEIVPLGGGGGDGGGVSSNSTNSSGSKLIAPQNSGRIAHAVWLEVWLVYAYTNACCSGG